MKNTHTLTVFGGPSLPAQQTVKVVNQVWIEPQREMLKEDISKCFNVCGEHLEGVQRYLAKDTVAAQGQRRGGDICIGTWELLRESGLSPSSFFLKS